MHRPTKLSYMIFTTIPKRYGFYCQKAQKSQTYRTVAHMGTEMSRNADDTASATLQVVKVADAIARGAWSTLNSTGDLIIASNAIRRITANAEMHRKLEFVIFVESSLLYARCTFVTV